MQAIVLKEFGAPEVLQVQTCPIPEPGKGQVLVKILAAGVNPIETYKRSGNYAALPPLPWTPGTDGAGIVEKVGPEVDLKEGTRVWLGSCLTGSYAQYALANIGDVNILPENISFEQGAALGIAYGTAYHAVYHIAEPNLKGPNIILIHGASGGVGTACIEFCKQIPETVIIGTAGTESGCKELLSLGVHHVFNHKTDDFQEQVTKITNGKGVDIIIEMLANVNLDKDMRALAIKGRIAVVGNRGTIEIDPRLLMQKRSSIRGVMLGNATPEEKQEMKLGIQKGLAEGSLKPLLGSKYPLEKAPEAHVNIINPPAGTGALGKIVLLPWEGKSNI